MKKRNYFTYQRIAGYGVFAPSPKLPFHWSGNFINPWNVIGNGNIEAVRWSICFDFAA
ncbi:MAG: hypothetical protein KAW42_06470 [Candidatus Atribacteria bacterium]|nr:hypothetical protein [Candidatus Atribacteria bacterium]MCK4309601.1 hypothetical protein [Candidatus Atribacteria bacterium]